MSSSKTILVAAAVAAAVLICVSGALADVVMETVAVGNPGNPGEWSGESYGGTGSDAIVGNVNYTYNVGRYEVTAGQYCEFLNAVAGDDTYGLYHGSMWFSTSGCKIQQNGSSPNYTYSVDPDWADRPVNFVSWGDAARFANWMHNGQGDGDTEDGSYFLDGAMTDAELMVITREADATWVIPSEDEWYKSAYHYNDDVTGNYFDYPTSSDIFPSNDLDLGGNNATYHDGDYTIGSPYYRTEVGAHQNSESPYGTFDQGGNVWEWNETAIGSYRGLRGGSYGPYGDYLHAADRVRHYPTYEVTFVGFRIAEVPEPATLVLLAFASLLVVSRRR